MLSIHQQEKTEKNVREAGQKRGPALFDFCFD